MDSESIKGLEERNSPFPSPSGECENEMFVGRQQIIADIAVTMVQPDGRLSNYSLIGLPRIGKSSLLKKIINDGILQKRYDRLAVTYISLDHCGSEKELWQLIGSKLIRSIKKTFSKREDFADFKEELEYSDISLDITKEEITYTMVLDLANCMKEVGYRGIIVVDEFDKFSSIASDSTVGRFRTLFNDADSGIRALLASRRTVERIEREVEGAINQNVSTLAPVFINRAYLKGFDDKERKEYWEGIEKRIDRTVSEVYSDAVYEYAGNHPLLINLLNHLYWKEEKNEEYLSCDLTPDFTSNILEQLHNAFSNAVWNDIEKWNLYHDLILHTWGPTFDINRDHIAQLDNYGVINQVDEIHSTAPYAIAISQYFTEWLDLKRTELPFRDIWSASEKNQRSLIMFYCDELFESNEEKMFQYIRKNAPNFEFGGDSEFASKSRINKMKASRDRNVRKYPKMSKNAISYSEPSDLPELFYRRDWQWFSNVFNGKWDEWEPKFKLMNEIRNIHFHGNEGMPETRINMAKNYCNEVNKKIEIFLKNKDKF